MPTPIYILTVVFLTTTIGFFALYLHEHTRRFWLSLDLKRAKALIEELKVGDEKRKFDIAVDSGRISRLASEFDELLEAIAKVGWGKLPFFISFTLAGLYARHFNEHSAISVAPAVSTTLFGINRKVNDFRAWLDASRDRRKQQTHTAPGSHRQPVCRGIISQPHPRL
jgi:hypothetical protein